MQLVAQAALQLPEVELPPTPPMTQYQELAPSWTPGM